MNILEVKILGLCITFLGNLLLGLCPLKVVGWLRMAGTSHPRFRSTLGYINCFTGGVFFGTFLIHLMPDVDASVVSMLQRWDITTKFPVAEFIVSLGFFIVLVIEGIVSMCHYNHRSQRELLVRVPYDIDSSTNYNSLDNSAVGSCSYEATGGHTDGDDVRVDYITDLQSSVETVEILRETSLIRALIFLLSLSIHSLLAGTVIGLQSTVDDVVTMLVAVDGHKWIIAFALGIELVQASISRLKCVVFMVLFALMTPVGIVIGICVDRDSQDLTSQETTSTLLQAMAAGTFLYVTFLEVLSKELSDRHNVLRIFFVIVGFSVMTAFKFLE